MIVPVVLCGGSGTRMWPLSRELYPKQFLSLVDDYSLLQNTLTRLEQLADVQPPSLICNENHRFMVADHMRVIDVDPNAIILEPVGRNTAPAVAVAALQLLAQEQNPVMLVLPADHVIQDESAFLSRVEAARPLASDGKLVTFGIVPTAPETGYGYIHCGAALNDDAFAVDRFVEKPDLPTAEGYVASGDYFWNSGIFMFTASRYIAELEKWAPEMVAACRLAVEKATIDADFFRLDKEAFAACPSDSIDYAVFERTEEAALIPLDAKWSDVGSWSALWEVGDQDGNGNVLRGDVISKNSRNSFVQASDRLVALLGVEDLIVVETPDAILVANKDDVQSVKQVVNELRDKGRNEASAHLRVYRPWGSYETIDIEDRFQVKRITVNPGERLSLQMHHHRAEHWIVVTGTALVTRGEEEILLSENESTYIPLGTKHRLENPGKIPLELIEVQSGPYLGEDDIVRFQDIYGR